MGPIKSEKAVEVLPSLPYPDPALAAMGEYPPLPAAVPRAAPVSPPLGWVYRSASTSPRGTTPAVPPQVGQRPAAEWTRCPAASLGRPAVTCRATAWPPRGAEASLSVT